MVVGVPVGVGVVAAIFAPVDPADRPVETIGVGGTGMGSEQLAGPSNRVGAPGLVANPGALYPHRLGIEDNDHESEVGSSGTAYADWNVTVDSITVDDGRLVASGTLFNRAESARSFRSSDWGLQHPSGEIRGSLVLSTDASGTIASGGSASFHLEFNIGDRRSGDEVFLIHDPVDFFDDARGVWAVVVP